MMAGAGGNYAATMMDLINQPGIKPCACPMKMPAIYFCFKNPCCNNG